MTFGKRCLQTILAILILCCFNAKDASAAAASKYVAVPFAAGQSVTQKETGYVYEEGTGKTIWTYYRYRVKVPGEGVLKVTLRKGKSRISGLSLSMYASLKAEEIVDDWFFSGKKKVVVTIPVSKGVYYFSGAEKETLKYTFTQQKPGSNYSAKRALALNKGTKAVITQTPDYNFPRWYKIRLTGKKKITIQSEYASLAVLTDASRTPVAVKLSGAKKNVLTSEKALKKGTYYLCMRCADLQEKLYSKRYYTTTVSWK